MVTPTIHFDTLYPTHINGHIHYPVITDPDGTPNRVLELDRPWKVDLTWHLRSDQPDTDPVTGINGKWIIKLGIESVGPGPEEYLDKIEKDLSDYDTFSKDECTWKHVFDVPVGKVKEEGVYQLVTLITYKFSDGSRGSMAGFLAGPLITFFSD